MCVELMYENDVLKRKTPEGRRIYLRSEFDDKSGHHHSEECSIPIARNES
jgi:hypothetical protein